MSRPEIKQPAQLRGKKIGVTRLGGSTDWALDAALKHWGIERGQITVIQTGGMPEGLAALSAPGPSTLWYLSPPSNFRAAKAGMHELEDVGQLKIVFPNTPLSTTRSYMRANRDTSSALHARLHPGIAAAAHGQRVQHESLVQIHQGDRHRDLSQAASNFRCALQRRPNSLCAVRRASTKSSGAPRARKRAKPKRRTSSITACCKSWKSPAGSKVGAK